MKEFCSQPRTIKDFSTKTTSHHSNPVTWLNHVRFKKGLRKEIADKMTQGSFKSTIPTTL